MGKTGAKLFLIGFNILFFILGAVLLAVGIFVLVSSPDMMSVMSRVPDEGETIDDVKDKPSLLEQGSRALCAAGAFILILGFLGCCGAWKEVRLFLGLYALFVLIILIIEVAGAAIVIVYQGKVKAAMRSYLNKTITLKYRHGIRLVDGDLVIPQNPLELAWDTAHIALECCGSDGLDDWQAAQVWDNVYAKPGGGVYVAEVPISCCLVANPDVFPSKVNELEFADLQNCLYNPDASNANMKGCFGHLKDVIMRMARLLQIFGLVVAVIEIIGIASAIYLLVQLGKNRNQAS